MTQINSILFHVKMQHQRLQNAFEYKLLNTNDICCLFFPPIHSMPSNFPCKITNFGYIELFFIYIQWNEVNDIYLKYTSTFEMVTRLNQITSWGLFEQKNKNKNANKIILEMWIKSITWNHNVIVVTTEREYIIRHVLTHFTWITYGKSVINLCWW